MKDLATFVRELQSTGEFERISLDVMAQFGNENDPLLGAQLLPERLKDANSEHGYVETQLRYQTVLGNAGTSYSPAQLDTDGNITGEFLVRPGKNDKAAQMTTQDYEEVRKLLLVAEDGNPADLQAAAQILSWYDKQINLPLIYLNELYRWQAIIDCLVKRRGSNAYSEDVIYPNPSGHRVNVAGGTVANPAGWYENDGSYDPYLDFFAAQRFLASKGYTVNRIISSFEPAYTFMKNPALVTRFSGIAINNGGSLAQIRPQVNMGQVNSELQANGLPNWEIYDRTYFYKDPSTGKITTGRYLERDDYYPVILVCNTGRNQQIDFGDRTGMVNSLTLENTLGYHCVGRVVGHNNPGRQTHQEVSTKHPMTLYAEEIEETLPVIQEPEAIYIIKVYKPTP